ncbi:MAG: hypothetical protein MI976_29160 [Pseudomonadales bacterium]|nr:hypothetical protein [Pseudomonadales bacterium]
MEALNIKPIESPLDFSHPQQYIDTGNVDFAYWRIGTGPDLMLIHG